MYKMQENIFKGEMESSRKICPLDKMNVKDRRILYELSKNGRFSISTIAKQIGVSRDIVSYRLNNMIKNRLVPGFTLFVNTNRLGLIKHIIYIKLQHTGKEENQLINKFIQEEDVVWVATCSGNWDLGIIILSRDLDHFNKTFNKVINICGNNLREYTVETEIEDKFIGLRFLVDGIKTKEETKKYLKDGFIKELKNPSPTDDPKIDSTDIKLINLLMKNSRMPLADICTNLHLSAPSIENRIKKLIKEEIIYGFMTQISFQILGLQWHWILLRTKNLTEEREKELKIYLEKHAYITWLVKTIGRWNFQLSVFAKDALHFREILSDLRKEFSDVIADYDSIMIFNQYKYMHSINL